MPKLHVFVDNNGDVLATGPAPEEVPMSKGESGPIFAGFSPANGDGSIRGYEIEVDDNVAIDRRNPNVDEFHSRLGALIRSSKGLKQIELRR